MYNEIVSFIRRTFKVPTDFIPLHEPRFWGNEIKYTTDAIESTFVSSVGAYVNRFEEEIASITGAKYAVATVNGTAALHTSLVLAGVEKNHEVITQPLTFVATANAIQYTGASPVFVDVCKHTLGMSFNALKAFLTQKCSFENGVTINNETKKVIKACVPMHTFGFPCEIEAIVNLCNDYNIVVVEDAAESLGSYVKDKHTGTIGKMGVLSFNGNKVITSGGGGAILTNDEVIAKKAKHITTTGKQQHKWAYFHDTLAFNYRMPNLNAALLCAQLEQLDFYLKQKRTLADLYNKFFKNSNFDFRTESDGTTANYWLNTLIVNTVEEREALLEFTNNNGVMTRPIWALMHKLPMYQSCFKADALENAEWLEGRVVNLPSSALKHL